MAQQYGTTNTINEEQARRYRQGANSSRVQFTRTDVQQSVVWLAIVLAIVAVVVHLVSWTIGAIVFVIGFCMPLKAVKRMFRLFGWK